MPSTMAPTPARPAPPPPIARFPPTLALVDSELLELIQTQNLLVCPEDAGSKAAGGGSEDASKPPPSAPNKNLAPYVQPASVDLPLSAKMCVLVKDRVLPYGRRVADVLPSLELARVDLSQPEGAVLLKGQTYLCYCGRVSMPADLRGSLSPKSSIGRVDVMVRGVFDGSGLYDLIEPGARGDLWMEISPRSFNVRVRAGQALSQMMVFRDHDERLGELSAAAAARNVPLVFSRTGEPLQAPLMHGNRVVLSLGLATGGGEGAVFGWEAVPTNEVLDLGAVGTHSPTRFFREVRLDCPTPRSKRSRQNEESAAGVNPVPRPEAAAARVGGGVQEARGEEGGQGQEGVREGEAAEEEEEECGQGGGDASSWDGGARITLEKDRFYILATKERIAVPTWTSAEMIPFSHHIGELRAHYAGFFDPGFGFGRDGDVKGTVGVLEVRPHETVTIYEGQPICLMEFFLNSKLPTRVYGDAGNSYMHQTGPKLAKYFKPLRPAAAAAVAAAAAAPAPAPEESGGGGARAGKKRVKEGGGRT